MQLEHATSTLDFRVSEVPATGVHINVQAFRSRVRLLVLPGTYVDLGSLGRHRSTVADRHGRAGSSRELHAVRLTGDIRGGSLRVLRRPYQLF
ncbi:hypothetical protein ACFQ9X_54325 [Catenulispora yoronensis]